MKPMKIATKVALIVGGAFCTAGIVLCGIMFATLGFDFSKLDTSPPYVEKTAEAPASIQNLTIATDNQEILVEPSTDGLVHVRYYENEDHRFTVNQTETSLSIEREDLRPWYRHISFNFFNNIGAYPIVIALPETYTGGLDFKTSNGKIMLADLQSKAAINLVTSNAPVSLHNIICSAMVVKTSNDTVSLADVQSTGTLDITTSNDAVTLTNVQTASTLSATTSNDRMTADKIQCNTLHLKSSNGKMELGAIEASGKMEVTTSNAAISFTQLLSPDIRLVSSNGDVSGRIKGDLYSYRIESHTSNGNNSLNQNDDPSRPNRLYVRTSNASIKVDIQP